MFSKYWRSKAKKSKEISLIVDNGVDKDRYVVPVSRNLLTKYSAVFRKMDEKGQFKGSREIRLKGITATGLQKIVEYIKTDSVFFRNHFEALETLRAAYVYQVQTMNDICSDFLVTAIEQKNVCDIYQFASDYLFHTVEYHCLRFIDHQAEAILKSAAFLTLKKSSVLGILKRQSLNVPTEMVVFRALLTWGLNDCMRRGVDAENVQEVFESVKPMLDCVRFGAMTGEELSDPDVDRFRKLLCSEDSSSKRRSLLSSETRSRTGTSESFSLQSREYVPDYEHSLEILECDEHAVGNGETFCMRIEVLKGRVFLTGVALAFERFVSNRSSTSCLYAALSASNVMTSDQKSARGTFMISSEEAVLMFQSPLVAKESERIEISLLVKRAVNICSVFVKSDIQIAMPETKCVAMKIIPSSAAGGSERSMFKSIKYFY